MMQKERKERNQLEFVSIESLEPVHIKLLQFDNKYVIINT